MTHSDGSYTIRTYGRDEWVRITAVKQAANGLVWDDTTNRWVKSSLPTWILERKVEAAR